MVMGYRKVISEKRCKISGFKNESVSEFHQLDKEICLFYRFCNLETHFHTQKKRRNFSVTPH